jgi:alkylation response protein AidB-like acyl-CoA dehydrogenase
MSYQAPLKEMAFVMNQLAGLSDVCKLPAYQESELDSEMTQAILEESAKFAQEVLDPLNWPADCEPGTFSGDQVFTAKGFKEAYELFTTGGWQGVFHPQEYGGQGLPKLVATACTEMMNSANLSFSLCPLLTDGAIEALMTAASDSLKNQFLPNMISGKWTGTMNLTEPQAGSDLALVRTKAISQVDGTYQIFGTKIYITYGEHDLAENIIHLVLARTPDAPEGVKGISLFVVPKFLVNEDSTLGQRNDVHCVSIEHKLGIKASPTAVLKFGENGGAIGYLVGQENRGLEYMFIMMNAARFNVGMQGVSVSERAYQRAVQYAKDRLQSRDLAGSTGPVAIIHHPDVKRMLLTMRAYTQATRSLAYIGAAAQDFSQYAKSEEEKLWSQAFFEFLVPIIKGFSTEISVEVASLGIQVHGGMGYIEETGAAQHFRDARILPIYEGTTAIQANDLVGRKTLRDGGKVAKRIAKEIEKTEEQLALNASEAALSMLTYLKAARGSFEEVVDYVVANTKEDIKAVFGGSVTYLKLAGLTLSGWQMARGLLIAQQLQKEDSDFYSAKITTALFFAEHMLTQVPGLAIAVTQGGKNINTMRAEQF